jgi:hypothetical protein
MASGGAILPLLPAAELLGIGTIQVFNSVTPLQFGSIIGPYRPGQWSEPQLTTITVPAPYVQVPPSTTSAITPGGQSSQAAQDAGSAGTFTMSVTKTATPPNASPKVYVFDAVMRIRHSQVARGAKNPIQTGANLVDHIVINPAELSLEILMSDVMAEYTAGTWTGASSKSVSCFQTLKQLQLARIPLTITTRLATYTNVYITNVPAIDDLRSKHGLRATVDLEQFFVASVQQSSVSARPQTTDATSLGATTADTPSGALSAQNQLPSATTGIPSPAAIQGNQGTVIGAGNWSSNNTSTLPAEDFDGS